MRRFCHIVDLTVPADHKVKVKVKMKEGENSKQIFGPSQRSEKIKKKNCGTCK